MKLPDTYQSIVLLLVTAMVVILVRPYYQTYALRQELLRKELETRAEMERAAIINEALKDKPYYLDWLRAKKDK